MRIISPTDRKPANPTFIRFLSVKCILVTTEFSPHKSIRKCPKDGNDSVFLTLSQTTNVRLIQTERVCSQQFHI